MLVASAILAEFPLEPAPADVSAVLHWSAPNHARGGSPVVIGIIDGGYLHGHPDLDPRRIVVRDCGGCAPGARVSGRHVLHAVTFLSGQGHVAIEGLLPEAHLLVGNAVGPDGIASPQSVATALEWMIDAGAGIVAIPLGGTEAHPCVERALERAAGSGIVILAAAGNVHPNPVLFPARHACVLSVGALDRRGALMAQCARRPQLDLAAPGHRIPSAISASETRALSGSSVATIIACAIYARRLVATRLP